MMPGRQVGPWQEYLEVEMRMIFGISEHARYRKLFLSTFRDRLAKNVGCAEILDSRCLADHSTPHIAQCFLLITVKQFKIENIEQGRFDVECVRFFEFYVVSLEE